MLAKAEVGDFNDTHQAMTSRLRRLEQLTIAG